MNYQTTQHYNPENCNPQSNGTVTAFQKIKSEMLVHISITTEGIKERNMQLTLNRNGVVYYTRPRVHPRTHARTHSTRNRYWARTRTYIIGG
jgi:hypothetical protein